MRKILFLIILLLIGCTEQKTQLTKKEITLPKPELDSEFSLERALSQRISVRSFSNEPLTLQEISQLLWSAQGIDAITAATRTAPSAGATHPLEAYLVVKDVEGLDKGIYHYNPKKHTIKMTSKNDIDISYKAPVFIILTAVYERTTNRYNTRGIRYVDIEIGHTAQNIHLQAISLGLGSFPIGAFDNKQIQEQLNIKEAPLYIIPIGRI